MVRGNERASGPVLRSRFRAVPDHSAPVTIVGVTTSAERQVDGANGDGDNNDDNDDDDAVDNDDNDYED